MNLKEYLEDATPTTLNKAGVAVHELLAELSEVHGVAVEDNLRQGGHEENDFGYEWLPKVDGNYSWMYICDDMLRGSSTRVGGKEPGPEGLITFGMNPVSIGPNSRKWINALAKLKWMVVGEIYDIETATFWKAPKEYGTPDAATIETEVYHLPATGLSENDVTSTNSARWMHWKWKAFVLPGL